MGARRKIKVTNQGQVEFYEDVANGKNRAALKAPASIAGDFDMTLPASNSAGFLKNDGAGALTWDGGTAASLQAAYTGGATIDTTPGPVQLNGTGGLDVVADINANGGLNVKGTGGAKFKGPDPWIDVTHPDYGAVGDGSTDDTAAIVAALAAVPASGAIVYFPPGTYKVTRNQLIVTISRTTLLGGMGAKIKSASGSGNANVLLTLGSAGAEITDIRVLNLELDGNFGAGGGNWAVTAASQSHNIDLLRVKRCWIQNCYIHDSAGDGVRFNYSVVGQVSSECYVTDNIIDTCARNGIGISDANHVVIARNQILNYNTAGILNETTNAANVSHTFIVSQNVLKPSDTQINTFNNNRSYGIGFKNAVGGGSGTFEETIGRVVISENQLYGVTDGGAQFPDVGIYVQTEAGVAVLGNFLYQTNTGISLVGSTGLSATTVNVNGNHVRKVFNIGIQMASQGACNGNIVEYVEVTGIVLVGNDNVCVGNVVRNCGINSYVAVLTPEQQSGIRISGSANVVLGNRSYDNQAAKTQTYGIAIDAAISGNIVRDNILTGNATGGLLEPATLLNRVSRNLGYATESSGAATIASGTTAITVNHGLAFTPANLRIFKVMPAANATNDPGIFWISNVTATTFDINCRADPGAGGWLFAWQVLPRDA